MANTLMFGPLPPCMVLAAGLGTRLRPLTDACPKPLIPLTPGREHPETPLGRILRTLAAGGCPKVVVNVHYLAPMVEAAVDAARRELGLVIEISHETELLETGGGLKQAAKLLGEANDGTVMVVNSDAIWSEQTVPLLQPLWEAWQARGATLDTLLTVVPQARVAGLFNHADFSLREDGTLVRVPRTPTAQGGTPAGVVYAGVHITRVGPVRALPERKFSLNVVWDGQLQAGRVGGWTYGGPWAEVGSPTGLAAAQALVAAHG
jgi:N-acetyl-alpha-D-muramate 1-phosphate uridylyltransferase